jgi:predicted nucleic acid-binding protein
MAPKRVFIDANILIGLGRSFDRFAHQLLRKLTATKKVELLVTNHTPNEITRHFTNRSLKKLEPLTDRGFLSQVREILQGSAPGMSMLELRTRCWDYHWSKVDEFLKECGAVIVDVNEVKPLDVLTDYSRHEGIFAEGPKKEEFPDAFIAAALYIEHQRKPIDRIFTEDKDFLRTDILKRARVPLSTKFEEFLDGIGLIKSEKDVPGMLSAAYQEFLEAMREAAQSLDIEDQWSQQTFIRRVRLMQIDPLTADMYSIDDTSVIFGRAKGDLEIIFGIPDRYDSVYDDTISYDASVPAETTIPFELEIFLEIERDRIGGIEKIVKAEFFQSKPVYFNSHTDKIIVRDERDLDDDHLLDEPAIPPRKPRNKRAERREHASRKKR